MKKKQFPKHKAALYFNEIAPLQGQGERCALFGHFYYPPDPDSPLTRPVAALPAGGWGVVNDIDVNDVICGGVYVERDGARQLFAVFQSGETYLYQGTSRTGFPKPPGVGFLSGVKQIGSGIYACGSQNTVFRFDGTNWTDVAPALRVGFGGPSDPILNAIDGFDENDVYSTGYEGQIVHYDGAQWRRIDSPTNQHMHQLICHPNGQIYVCGRGGVVFRGGATGWEDLSLPGYNEDFWGLAAFREEIFVCSYRNLFRVTESGLVEEKVPANSAGTFYRLAANESYLWATTGTGRVLRFDSKMWAELVWPDSV